MSTKRSATTELNHENWNDEQEPEEAGTFTKASDDIMEKRVVKIAIRRLQANEDDTRSAFGTFTGFKTSASGLSPFGSLASTNTSSVAPKTFASISKPPASNGATKSNENGRSKKENPDVQVSSNTAINKKTVSDQEDQNTSKKSSEYFAKLKGLNESVAQWIKTHVDENPFCILTPIFKDYEKYLKEMEGSKKLSQETGSSKNETEKAQTVEPKQSLLTIDKKEIGNTEKKADSSLYGGATAKSSLSPSASNPEKSIFGDISPNSKSVFGKSKNTVDYNNSIFSSAEQSSNTQKSIFGNPTSKVMFGNISSDKNPFLSKTSTISQTKSEEKETNSDTNTTSSTFAPKSTATFCFGQSSTTSSTTGFSFGSAKPFTFGAEMVKPQESEDKAENEGKDEDDEPPKVEIKPITEEGAIYEQRCKVFVKKDGNFTDRGVGVLFLKPTPNEKTQLIVRAETSLGNLLLNTLLTASIPVKRMNKNSIMLVCLPKPESSPPPVPVLLRVKTDEDADKLFEALTKHKK